MDELLNQPALVAFLAAMLRCAVPVAFAALGATIAERSGVYNVGLEGSLLVGAFAAAAGALLTGSPYQGALIGLVAGVLLGLLQAALTVWLRSDQLVAGIAVNLFCAGLTAYLARLVFGESQGSTTLPGFEPVPLPGLSSIPLLGPSLFSQDVLAYMLAALVLVASFVLYRTHAGLALRATGENPRAADSAGVPVLKVRAVAVVISSALAALGGAHLVLAQIHIFAENMGGGRGFLALAIAILGRWNPALVLLAALFFGLCDAAQLSLQFSHPEVPYQLFLMLPYVASIVALVGLMGRARAPEAVGRPYDRESR
ncbi:MAG TPA: ABC transporter permease [Burkholderiaceae bacterium]|nr:ABC transporter permease [Burkholderiaceae bacterium]